MEGKLRIYLKDWLKNRVEFKTEKEALEAVKRDGYALQFVNSSFFEGE